MMRYRHRELFLPNGNGCSFHKCASEKARMRVGAARALLHPIEFFASQ